jgi:leucyl-tRNA synthetase
VPFKPPPADARQVTTETEEMRFNTAIAAMMEFVNAVYKWDTRPRAALAPFVLLLAPYAPHVAEELWERLRQSNGQSNGQPGGSLAYEPWPEADEALLVVDSVQLPVQVGGGERIGTWGAHTFLEWAAWRRRRC